MLTYPRKPDYPPSVRVAQSCLTLCNPTRLLHPWNSSGKNAGVGNHSLLQGIFPSQGLNPGLLRCRQILYQLRHQGSPSSIQYLLGTIGTFDNLLLISYYKCLLLISSFRVSHNSGLLLLKLLAKFHSTPLFKWGNMDV